MAMGMVYGSLLFLILCVSTATAVEARREAVYDNIPDEFLGKRQRHPLPEAGSIEAFQVAEPVISPDPPKDEHGCVQTQLLMQHVFAFSYGHPFVGMCSSRSYVSEVVTVFRPVYTPTMFIQSRHYEPHCHVQRSPV